MQEIELQEQDNLVPRNGDINGDIKRATFDDILRHLGEFGLMQKLVYFIIHVRHPYHRLCHDPDGLDLCWG